MKSQHDIEISISYLSWINSQLREEAGERLQEETDAETKNRLQAALFAGVASMSMFFLSLF